MNYRTNEDRRLADPYVLTYNSILSVSFADEGAEPLTLPEIKDWIIETSSDRDAFLVSLGKMCRAHMEKYTGLGLVPRTITATLNNSRGNIDLPYGPVTTFTSMEDKEGEEILVDNYKIYGSGFQWIESPTNDFMTVEYEAGYTASTIPPDLKMALLRLIAWCYQHRGDEDFMAKGLSMFCASHRRMTWLL